MKKVLFISFLLAVLMIYLNASSLAQGGKITIGKLKVIPGISVEGEHDDNIYLGNGTNNDNELKESDWITHAKPSILFDYSFGDRGGVSLGYQGDLAYYSDNDQNDWQTHRGIYNFNYQAPGGLILGLSDIYTDAEDPYGSDTQFKQGVPQIARWNNDLKAKIGYDFSNRFKLFAFYNNYQQDYDELQDFTQDYYDNEYGVGANVRLMPKTWGFARYHYGKRNYFSHPAGTGSNMANDADSDWQRVNVGFGWDPGAKLSGELNFGYQWKDYDNLRDIAGNRYEDKNTWIANTLLTFEATSTTTLIFTISRALRESGSITNEYFEDTGIGLSVIQMLSRKFTFNLRGSYSKNDYNEPVVNKREQDNYRGSVGLRYNIQQWLSAGASYLYSKKDSNYQIDEYTDNRVGFSLSLIY